MHDEEDIFVTSSLGNVGGQETIVEGLLWVERG